MNKAFVRDAEPMSERCPRCASIGQPVFGVTLDAFIKSEHRAQLGDTACFCPSESCRIAYFDAFERHVTLDELAKPVFPKDPLAPICGCFGFTCEEIEADVRENVATRTRAL